MARATRMKGETGSGSASPRPGSVAARRAAGTNKRAVNQAKKAKASGSSSTSKPTGRRCGTGPSSGPTRPIRTCGTRARGEAGTSKPQGTIATRRKGEGGTSGGSTTGPRPGRPTPKPQGTIATRRKGESGSSNPSPATRRRGESGSGTKPKPKSGGGVNKTQAMIRSEMGGSTAGPRPTPKPSGSKPTKMPKRDVAKESKSFKDKVMKKYNFAAKSKGAGDRFRPSKKKK